MLEKRCSRLPRSHMMFDACCSSRPWSHRMLDGYRFSRPQIRRMLDGCRLGLLCSTGCSKRAARARRREGRPKWPLEEGCLLFVYYRHHFFSAPPCFVHVMHVTEQNARELGNGCTDESQMRLGPCLSNCPTLDASSTCILCVWEMLE